MGPRPVWVDLVITFYRASGPGGQHRIKTESAVRIKHLPTGIIVTATESRSQHENREKALERLRERLAALTVGPSGAYRPNPAEPLSSGASAKRNGMARSSGGGRRSRIRSLS